MRGSVASLTTVIGAPGAATALGEATEAWGAVAQGGSDDVGFEAQPAAAASISAAGAANSR